MRTQTTQQQQKLYTDLFGKEEQAEVDRFEKEQKDKQVIEKQQEQDLQEVGFETETIEDTMYKRVVLVTYK